MTTIVMLVLGGAFLLAAIAYFAATADVAPNPVSHSTSMSGSYLIVRPSSTAASRPIRWR